MLRLAAASAVAVIVIGLADRAASTAHLDLERYEAWVQRGHTLTMSGLWANADVSLDLLLRPRGVHGELQIRVNDDVATVRIREPKAQVVSVSGRVDAEGVLRIGLMPAEKGQGHHVRIEELSVRQQGPGGIPPLRWLQYLTVVVLSGALGFWASSGARGAFGGLLGAAGFLAAAVWAFRLQALLFLPWMIALLGISLVIAGVASVGLRMPRWAAALVCLMFLVRAAAFLQPGFPAIDAAFHSENLRYFKAGQVIESAAPGPEKGGMAVPYPTVFYAVLSPISDLDWPTPQFPVRLAMALFECTVPLLVFAIMRSAGASETAAAYGAAVQAVLPEGTLVLGKGIAANITGGWTSLLTVFGLVSRLSAVTVTGLFAVAFLSHLGAGLTFAVLVVSWAVYGAVRKGWPRRRVLALLVPGALGLALAWLAYYREVEGTAAAAAGSIGSHVLTQTSDFFWVRWYRVGKLLQDLVLKFGVTPLVLAWFGMRRSDAPDALKGLLVPWFLTGIATGLLALLSPLPLRFEYFLLPAVAMAAGLGAERASRRWAVLGLLVPLAVQIGLTGFLLARRFSLISVILESPRWPLPFGRDWSK